MAGYGWNLRHGRQQLPHNPSQIACRLCNQVFLSTQALINHIETHMVEDHEAASRKQQQQKTNFMSTQRDLFAVNQFRPSFPSLTPTTTPLSSSALKTQPFFPVQFSSPLERNPVPKVVPQFVNSQPPILPPPTPPPVSPMMRNNMTPAMSLVQQPMQQQRVGIEDGFYTKPFLCLLERPIPKSTDKPNVIVLDLTLKL